jgi:hypothetical protein
VKYQWDFGDGTSGEGLQAQHVYAAAGLYFVTLAVTDNGNATDSCTGNVLVGQDLTPYTSRFSLNFQRPGNDRFSLASRNTPVNPAMVTTAGLSGSVRLGTVEYPFVLDERGSYKVPPLKVKLVPKRRQINITLTHASLQAALAPSGADSRDVKHLVVRVPFALYLTDGTVAGSPGLPYDYSARQGRTGTGKLIVVK